MEPNLQTYYTSLLCMVQALRPVDQENVLASYLSLGKPSKIKNGLFSDIDHISLNTHPPPPKDDI